MPKSMHCSLKRRNKKPKLNRKKVGKMDKKAMKMLKKITQLYVP